MTRGRKKDPTIPPSRTLAQQRDYRARKAHYIATLEERCRRAEEENIQLRRELDETKALLTAPAIPFHPETTEASSELMHNLSIASASLAKFQRLAFANIHPAKERPGVQISNESMPEYQRASDTVQGTPVIHRKRLCREDSPTPLPQLSHRPSSPAFPRLSPDIDSECCGGLLDCEDLVEKDLSSRTTSRLSGIRTTSDYRLE